MMRSKNVKLTVSIASLLLCVCMLFSFGSIKSVFASSGGQSETYVENDESSIVELYEQFGELVAESGVDPDDHFTKVYLTRFGVENVALAKMSDIFTLAYQKTLYAELFSDETLSAFSYERQTEAKRLREELYKCMVVGNWIASGNIDEVYAKFDEIFGEVDKYCEALLDLLEKDFDMLDDYLLDAVTEIDEYYQGLLKESNESPSVTETTSPYVYSSAQRTALKEVYDRYVTEFEGELYPNYEDAFAEFYSEEDYYLPSQFKQYAAAVDEIVAEAKKALASVPKNTIEFAYAKFNDWLNSENSEKDQDTQKAINQAIKVYESASAEVQQYYASEYELLKKWADKSKVEFGDFKTSSYTVSSVRVTALYKYDKTPAKVIPYGLELRVYPSYNGSAMRTVSRSIKECDEDLSTSYVIFMQFYVKDGISKGKPYELPTKDPETGKPVIYEIEVDLGSYYKNYLSKESYFKDQTENITKAYALISDSGYTAETSLCYAYSNGVTDKLDYEFKEGGKIVFYASTLSNFCFAGIDTSTLLTNPLFWVAVIVALILVIIIIKIIVKNKKYKIIFYTNGGSKVKQVKAAKNEYFVMPDAPVKPNFVFAGWYTDKELKNKFIGIRMVNRRKIKLYAKWAAPATQERLQQFYDILRKTMTSYQKVSFKPTLGLVEKEHLASIYCREANVEMYLAIDPEKAKKSGYEVIAHQDKKFAELPSKFIVSTEDSFAAALKLVKELFTSKGLQIREDDEIKVAEGTNRENGFAYYVTNDRVAETPADYFELLRIALKGYVLEKDLGYFKEGEKFTFARIYVTDLEAQLYLPNPHGSKPARIRDARFEDTPNFIEIKTANDIPAAYEKIEALMLSYGFTKCPENSNDLADVKVPDEHGFSYTVKF